VNDIPVDRSRKSRSETGRADASLKPVLSYLGGMRFLIEINAITEVVR
jgi:hypothetical protein